MLYDVIMGRARSTSDIQEDEILEWSRFIKGTDEVSRPFRLQSLGGPLMKDYRRLRTPLWDSGRSADATPRISSNWESPILRIIHRPERSNPAFQTPRTARIADCDADATASGPNFAIICNPTRLNDENHFLAIRPSRAAAMWNKLNAFNHEEELI